MSISLSFEELWKMRTLLEKGESLSISEQIRIFNELDRVRVSYNEEYNFRVVMQSNLESLENRVKELEDSK